MINFYGEHTCARDAHLLLSQFCTRLKGKAMKKLLINYEDLVALGFKPNQARTIIRNAKKLMAKKVIHFIMGKELVLFQLMQFQKSQVYHSLIRQRVVINDTD